MQANGTVILIGLASIGVLATSGSFAPLVLAFELVQFDHKCSSLLPIDMTNHMKHNHSSFRNFWQSIPFDITTITKFNDVNISLQGKSQTISSPRI